MACTGMKEIFRDHRGWRHFRSVGWFPLFALTVILANLPTSIHSSDGCKDGEYRINELVTSSPGMINTEMTTNSMTETTVGCGNCSEKIKECIRCEHSNSSLVCQNCSHGYQLTDDNRNCTLVPPHTTPKQSDSTTIIIAVVVSVGCVIIIVAIIVAIVFAARKGKLEKCHCACARSRSPTPPPMPSADDLGVSFKKDDNESGTGQRVDLRYTEEPGVPQNRVESVHYDRFIGPGEDDDDVYMNDIPMANIPATVQEEEEDDELYVNNTEFSSPANQSNANTSRNTTTTPVASSSNTKTTPVASGSKPPRPKPKPQTPAKPTSATKPKLQPEENRVSIFPPEDPDEIYLNEQELKGNDDDEDDKEDYVNAEDYEPGKR